MLACKNVRMSKSRKEARVGKEQCDAASKKGEWNKKQNECGQSHLLPQIGRGPAEDVPAYLHFAAFAAFCCRYISEDMPLAGK